MLRFYLRLVSLPILLFTAVLLLIHAQPYDDHELRQLLLPDGCPAPCFMGIRPGVTTIEEAGRILEASEWAKDVQNGPFDLIWRWSNRKPDWIGAGENFGGTIS